MESIFNSVWSVRSLSLAQLSIKHYGIVYEVDDASEEKPIGIPPRGKALRYLQDPCVFDRLSGSTFC